jgi:glycyl-tRNA synthetase
MTHTGYTLENMEPIVSLAKRRGFVFQGSEIYGGFGNSWDYGPLGVLMENNVKAAWWRAMVQLRDDMVGLDAAILMSPQVWQASGHVGHFTDPLVDCTTCKLRYRADHAEQTPCGNPEWHKQGLMAATCPGVKTEARQFNMMFKTFVGPLEESAAVAYLRPETAQGIFVNFANILGTSRKKLPFGIAQIGKSFRNEITPGNFIFRTREFEQMEMEYFITPGTEGEWHPYWGDQRVNWYKHLGVRDENIRIRDLPPEDLAHYSKGTKEIEYLWPGGLGWAELEGVASRGDYDLGRHQEASGRDLTFFDEEKKERYLPYVIEPAVGVGRAVLVFLLDAYDEEPDKEGTRVVLRLHPAIAPIKVAILPLSKKEPLGGLARAVAASLRPHMMIQFDDTQAIGRRYRRQDEIGTPLCVTVDFESIEDCAVTIRERDSMAQERVPIAELLPRLQEKLGT